MKKLIQFVLVFSGILLLSAFLAPILFDFLPFKFERIFNRLVMIFSLIAVVCLVRVRKESCLHYGLAWRPNSLSLFNFGFISGVILLTLVVVLRFYAGDASWDVRGYGAGEWVWRGIKIIAAALLIGVLEEFFFRGFVFNSLSKNLKLNLFWSFVITNFFYAIVHFVSVKKIYIGPDPTFFDSLKLIAAPLAAFLAWDKIWTGVVGLFLFGGVLTDLVRRTGSLYPAIGLHAGCVFFLKFDGILVDFKDTSLLVYGTNKIYDGVLGWIFLIGLWIFYRMVLKHHGESAHAKVLV